MQKTVARQIVFSIFHDLFGVAFGEDLHYSFAGKTDKQIFRELAELSGVPEDVQRIHLREFEERLGRELSQRCTEETIRLLPGVAELLRLAADQAGVTLGLVTGNLQIVSYAKLRAHSQDHHFPFGAFGSDHFDRNLLPPLALARARQHRPAANFAAEHTVVIGDTPRDIECARANAMKAVAVATGPFAAADLEQHAPDILFENLADAGPSFEKLLALVKE